MTAVTGRNVFLGLPELLYGTDVWPLFTHWHVVLIYELLLDLLSLINHIPDLRACILLGKYLTNHFSR